jgi:hypothetical protein
MASLRHGFEEPGDVEDIHLVVDTHPYVDMGRWPKRLAEFHIQRWLDGAYLQSRLGWEVAIHPDDMPRILESRKGRELSQ